jgi:hypothetical protein
MIENIFIIKEQIEKRMDKRIKYPNMIQSPSASARSAFDIRVFFDKSSNLGAKTALSCAILYARAPSDYY